MAMEYLQNVGNTSSNGLVSIVTLVFGGVFFMVLQQFNVYWKLVQWTITYFHGMFEALVQFHNPSIYIHNIPSWWFQPIWSILVKLEIFSPRFGMKNKKYLKPPPPIDNMTYALRVCWLFRLPWKYHLHTRTRNLCKKPGRQVQTRRLPWRRSKVKGTEEWPINKASLSDIVDGRNPAPVDR